MKSRIDSTTCEQCGLCIAVCPAAIPQRVSGQAEHDIVQLHTDRLYACVTCGHCMAICPTQSVHIDGLSYEEHLYESRGHHSNFLECVRTRRDPVAPVEAGHAATTISIVADIATRVGRELTWDWNTETFINDDQANQMLQRPMRSPWSL